MLSTTTEDLLTTTIKSRTNNMSVVNEVVEFVRKSCEERSLDYTKVSDELIRSIQATAEIRSIAAYVRAVVNKLDYLKFKKVNPKITVWTFHLALVKNGFEGETWELNYLYELEERCLEAIGADNVNMLMQTNHAIFKYCVANNKKTYKDFADFLLRSKLIKMKSINVKELKEKSKKEIEEWDKLIDDIENEPEIEIGGLENGEDIYYRTFSKDSINK